MTSRTIYYRIARGLTIALCMIFTPIQCSNQSGISTVDDSTSSLNIIINEESSSRTISPDMTIAVYRIIIYRTGYTTITEDIDASSSTYTKLGLAIGNWTIVVRGLNSAGNIIGRSSSQTVTIKTDETTTCTCTVSPITGNGSISISLNWSTVPVTISRVWLVQGTTEINLTTANSAANPTVYSNSTVAAGYYQLWITYRMTSTSTEHTEPVGADGTVRIASGLTTSATIEMGVDEDGNLGVSIINNMETPLNVAISGINNTVTYGTALTATGKVTDVNGGSISDTIYYQWYLNGTEQTSTGSTISLSGLNPGTYTLFLYAYTNNYTRAGSCRLTFTVKQALVIEKIRFNEYITFFTTYGSDRESIRLFNSWGSMIRA